MGSQGKQSLQERVLTGQFSTHSSIVAGHTPARAYRRSLESALKTFTPGETVDIYFDPARPQMSGLGDRTENFREIFASVLVSSSFIASLGTLLLYLRRRRAR
jgi:hypothetical protein